jgi:effector-binding domain-containing protein
LGHWFPSRNAEKVQLVSCHPDVECRAVTSEIQVLNYTIRVERFPSQALAVVRRRAGKPQLGNVIPEACGTVWSALKSQQIKGAGRHVAVYLDDLINLEVGMEMDQPISAFGDVLPSSLPSGEVATTTHFGPYHLRDAAHDAIQKWCAANQRTVAGPRWETYGHWVDEWNRDPSKIRTDVFYLLKS